MYNVGTHGLHKNRNQTPPQFSKLDFYSQLDSIATTKKGKKLSKSGAGVPEAGKGGEQGGHAPPDFSDIDKKTGGEIGNLLVFSSAPKLLEDFWTFYPL